MPIAYYISVKRKKEEKMKTNLILKQMVKKGVFAVLFLIFSLPLYAKELPYVPGEILVKFKASTKKYEAKSEHKLRYKLRAKRINKFSINNVTHIKLPRSISVKQAIREACKDKNVVYAEPNYKLHANRMILIERKDKCYKKREPRCYEGKETELETRYIPNDAYFDQLWGMEKIQAPEAWDITKGDSEIIVAVIDSGVDYTHPDLAENMWTGPNGEYGYDFANNDNDPMDDVGHGTHCAGTIAAAADNNIGVVGVAPKVKIMALKFLDKDGYGDIAGAIAALEYAVSHGAKITSNSYGGNQFSQALLDAVTESHNAGVLFVAAAGNESMNNDLFPFYPSSFEAPNVVSVAATDFDDYLALFSCYGPESVDLAAPGVAILSTIPGNKYDSFQGTSMACPHVSGVCALIWSNNPDWTNTDVKEKLLQSVDKVSYLEGMVLTGGRVNAYKAVLGGGSDEPEPPADEKPDVPVNLKAVTGHKEVNLTWDANTEPDIAGYNIYRKYDEVDYRRINHDVVAVNNYKDVYVINYIPYKYAVTAVDEAGNESDLSNEVLVMAVDGIPPYAPANLRATPGNREINLTWDKVWEPDVARYYIYRKYGDIDYEKVHSVPATLGIVTPTNSTIYKWKDTDVINGITYQYVVTAVDNEGNESLYSNEVSVLPEDTDAPAAPAGINTAIGNKKVSLTWNENTETDLAGYNVYRKEYKNTGYKKVNNNLVTNVSYTDTSVWNGGDFWYVLTALDNNGNESVYSSSVFAKPKGPDTPPAAPTGLVSIGYYKYIELNWNANIESDLAGYNVYKHIHNGQTPYWHYEKITDELIITTHYIDTDVAGRFDYSYKVTAVDIYGNESDLSKQGNAFLIQPKPIMVIEPSELLTVTLFPNETATQSIEISNEGDVTMRYRIMLWASNWLKIDCMEGEVEPGNSQKLTVTYDSTGLEERSHEAYIEIYADFNSAMLKANLTVESAPAPNIIIEPKELPRIDISPNSTVNQILTITNNGTVDLEVNVQAVLDDVIRDLPTSDEAPDTDIEDNRIIDWEMLKDTDYADGEIIVKFMPEVRSQNTVVDFRLLGARTIKEIPEFGIKHIKIRKDKDIVETINILNKMPEIERAEPNFILHADRSPNDLNHFWQWALNNTGVHGGIAGADIDAYRAWDITTGSSEVVVAVLDTGIDYTHPDLAANIWVNPGEDINNNGKVDSTDFNGIDDDGNGYVDDLRGWDFVNNDNDPMDDNYHGTFCAGIIGATGNNYIGITGVCWNVKIMPLKILNEEGAGGLTSALEALAYAVNKGVKITSNSYGGYVAYPNRPLIFKEIIESENEGGEYNFLFVTAAGNDGWDNDNINPGPSAEFPGPHYPSSFDSPNIIAVAATNYSDQLANYFTDGWNSNYGKNSVDLAAPGDFIYSTGPYHGYYFNCGTSTACPFVAGTCALILSEYPDISKLQIKDRILFGVDELDSLSDKVLTGGRLNAYKALTVEVQEPWLSISPVQAVITPGSSREVTMTYNSNNLLVGTYNSSITIGSNDPDTPEIELPVEMNVYMPTPLPYPRPDPIKDNLDADDDNIYDVFDAFFLDETEWEDTDGDGIGNNADWDDDNDDVADEDDIFPLNIEKSLYKASPSIFTRVTLTKEILSEIKEEHFKSIDEMIVLSAEDIREGDIEHFIRTAHKCDTLVFSPAPVIRTIDIKRRVEAVIDWVSRNDFDGIVTNSTDYSFIANLGTALHNRGNTLFINVTYDKDLDLYNLDQYIDKLIVKVNTEDEFVIETVFDELRLQVQEEKIILELPKERFYDPEE